MLLKIYCVLSLRNGKGLYTGPSQRKVADRLAPGTIYGRGPGVLEAREDVRDRAERFRGWCPLLARTEAEA